MKGSLAPATVFDGPGIVSACHQGKIAVVARIIAFIPDARVFDFLVGNLETMTGGTNKSTGVAPYAVIGNIFKLR